MKISLLRFSSDFTSSAKERSPLWEGMDLSQDERNSSYELCLFPAVLQVGDFGAKAWALCNSHVFYPHRKILYGFSTTEFWRGRRLKGHQKHSGPPWNFISSSITPTEDPIPYSRQAILYHQRDGTSRGQSHPAHRGAINKHRHKNQCSALGAFDSRSSVTPVSDSPFTALPTSETETSQHTGYPFPHPHSCKKKPKKKPQKEKKSSL